jgi:hypothetical protein
VIAPARFGGRDVVHHPLLLELHHERIACGPTVAKQRFGFARPIEHIGGRRELDLKLCAVDATTAEEHVIRTVMGHHVRSPQHRFPTRRLDAQRGVLPHPMHARYLGRCRVCELDLVVGIGRFGMRDAEQVPNAIRRLRDRVIVDVPGPGHVRARVVHVVERACDRHVRAQTRRRIARPSYAAISRGHMPTSIGRREPGVVRLGRSRIRWPNRARIARLAHWLRARRHRGRARICRRALPWPRIELRAIHAIRPAADSCIAWSGSVERSVRLAVARAAGTGTHEREHQRRGAPVWRRMT